MTTELKRLARIAVLAEPMFRTMWNAMWPTGMCVNASLLMAPILRANSDDGWHVALGEGHAWCEADNGDLIDMTYGQFFEQSWSRRSCNAPVFPGVNKNNPVLVLAGGAIRPNNLVAIHHVPLDEEEEFRRKAQVRIDPDGSAFPLGVGIKERYWPPQPVDLKS